MEGKRQRSVATRSIALQSCLSRQYLLIAEHQVQVTRAPPQAPCSSNVILKFERGLPLVSNKEETELGLRISRGGL